MSFSVTLSPPPSLTSFPQRSDFETNSSFKLNLNLKSHSFQTLPRLQASRRVPNFPQGRDALVDDPRNWLDADEEEEEEDDEDGDEDEDRSLDLLARFLQNVFKKISRRARKAVRSVLPLSIPTKLVIQTHWAPLASILFFFFFFFLIFFFVYRWGFL